jgi:hypothetical protein
MLSQVLRIGFRMRPNPRTSGNTVQTAHKLLHQGVGIEDLSPLFESTLAVGTRWVSPIMTKSCSSVIFAKAAFSSLQKMNIGIVLWH